MEKSGRQFGSKICKAWADGKESSDPNAETGDDTEALSGAGSFDGDAKIGNEVFIFAAARFFVRLSQ